MTSQPRSAVVLTRISDARNGEDRGVKDQQTDARQFARRLGWTVGQVVVENATSAFKRRKVTLPDGRTVLRTVRPGFRRVLDLLATGQADALIAYDLDRVARDPRDLEDLIDCVEATGVPVESVTGSLKLSSDADITMARVMVAVGNKSSRDTSRRVARSARTRAENGGYHGGKRPFGVDRRGTALVPEEAVEIRRAAAALLAGTSLHRIVADLNAREVPTVTGAQCYWPRKDGHNDKGCPGCRYRGRWTTNALRQVLLSPRVAGYVAYHGQIVHTDNGNGAEAVRSRWPAILDPDTWRSVVALLNDPARRTTPGNQVAWLGSGLYRCGRCGSIMRVTKSSGSKLPTYRCAGLGNPPAKPGHLSRGAAQLDMAVQAVVVARLSDPDALAVIRKRRATTQPGVDVTQVTATIAKLERRLKELQREMTDPDGSPVTEVKQAMADVRERLTTEEAKLVTTATPDPLGPFDSTGKDAAEIWVDLTLDQQRAVIDLLCTVVVKPSRRGRAKGTTRKADGTYGGSGANFDPQAFEVNWK